MANIFREAMKGKPINTDNQSPSYMDKLAQFGPGGSMWDDPQYRHRKAEGTMTNWDEYFAEGSQGIIPDAWQKPFRKGAGDSLLGGPTWFNADESQLRNLSARGDGGKEQYVPSAMDGSAGYEDYLSSSEELPVSEEMNPREFAKVFDPTSNTDVMKMQGMLGNVKEDGILGPETLASLQELQGVSPQPQASGEMEDEYGDMVSYGDPPPAGFDRNIDMSGEPNPQEWLQGMDAEYGSKPYNEADYANPEFQGPTQDEADFQAEENAWMENANANVSKYEANAQESYYDDFFNEEENDLNPEYRYGNSVNPALDATRTEGINRFMPGSPGNFAEGSGGVGMQYGGNVQNLDMGEAPAQNNITTAMNNEMSDDELIKTGKMRNPNTGDIEQLEEMLDEDGNFMGWDTEVPDPGGDPSQYDVGSPYPQPGIPWETEQNVGPYNPQRSRQDILAEFQNRRQS